MSRIARYAACLAALVLAACQSAPDPIYDRFPALGTLVEVVIFAPPGRVDAALRDLREALDRASKDWHGWGDGELARYNDALATRPDTPAPKTLATLLERATTLGALSGGFFEPRIGALTELWGFHMTERLPGPPPSAEDIVRWREGGLPVRWDLGGFAKGVAVASAIDLLQAHGIEHALVNAGGDIAVLGKHRGRAWRIGVRDPRGTGILGGLELQDGEVVFTSGDHERGFEWDGHHHHHILDPRTGRPTQGTASVTVVHHDAAVADAAATALVVAGDGWAATARDMGLHFVMRVRTDGAVELLPAMAERLQFETHVPSRRVME